MEIRGEPVAAKISLNEKIATVMTKEADQSNVQNPIRLIHPPDLKNGREMDMEPLRASMTAGMDFAFPDDDSVVYINEHGQLATFSMDGESTPVYPGHDILRFALSGGYHTIAYLCDDGSIYSHPT